MLLQRYRSLIDGVLINGRAIVLSTLEELDRVLELVSEELGVTDVSRSMSGHRSSVDRRDEYVLLCVDLNGISARFVLTLYKPYLLISIERNICSVTTLLHFFKTCKP
jgi:hypothetical protein